MNGFEGAPKVWLCLRNGISQDFPFRGALHPKGPELEKIQDRSPGLKFSSAMRPGRVNLREIFLFSRRFWREILVKFSVAHPNPGKRSTENFTKISRQISRHLWQRKNRENFHFRTSAG